MSHKNQHGGWAAAAPRRREDYIMCNFCGIRHATPNRTYSYPTDDDRLTPWRLLGMVAWVLLFFWLPMIALVYVGAAVMQ